MTDRTREDAYSRLMNKAFAEAIPLSCQIEITYRCNHLCSFCYNSPTGEPEMTTEQIFDVLGKSAELGVLYCTLTGGEALCHKDFFKIAAEVRRLNMALRIYSNGYLMADKKMVRKIKELEPMEVEITLHGARPETHDALTRIKGGFARTVQAIENLNEAGVKVVLKCPITKLNQNELFEIKALARQLGRPIVFDAVITPRDNGDLDPLSLCPDKEFTDRYWGEWYSQLNDGQLPPRGNHCHSDGSANCGTGRAGFTIDPYGNLYPCVALRRKVVNVLEVASLKEIWHRSRVLQEVRDLSVEAKKRVAAHPDGQFLPGFCLGVAEVQTGDPLGFYPQVEANARAVRRNYELLQIGEGTDGGRKSA